MNYVHIHYDPVRNGEIVSWIEGPTLHDYSVSNESHLAGCLVTTFEVLEDHKIEVNPKTQRIDIQSLELVDKYDDEAAHAHLPTEIDVRAAILLELEFTDGYINMAIDRPIRDSYALDWKPYRQTLRDLSKLKGGHLEWIKSWPLRPNDVDAIANLRQKVSND